MANLEMIGKNKKVSKHGNRFYTPLDMVIIKKDTALRNSQKKRKEVPDHPNEYISRCGCGHEGCFIHGSTPTKETQDEHNRTIERYQRRHH